MHSIFPELFCIIVKVVLRRLAFLRWTTRPPIFFDNGEMLGGKNTVGSVFSPFTFVERKIFFSVACLLDCKLVRYCNIEVFLLVSPFLRVLFVQIWIKKWWTKMSVYKKLIQVKTTAWCVAVNFSLAWTNMSVMEQLSIARKMYDNKDLRPFRACFLKTQVETFDFCFWILRACGKD